jgi:hypothetical protein
MKIRPILVSSAQVFCLAAFVAGCAATPTENRPTISPAAVSENTAVSEGLFCGFDDAIPQPSGDTASGGSLLGRTSKL